MMVSPIRAGARPGDGLVVVSAPADRRVHRAVGLRHANPIHTDKPGVARTVGSAVLPGTAGIRIMGAATHRKRGEQNRKKKTPDIHGRSY